MAKEKTYLNILDQLLDHGIEESETEDARKRGDDLSGLTQSMAEDGSFNSHLSASADAGRTHIAKKLSDDNVLNDLEISEGKAKSNKDGLANAANEAAVCAAIDKLLKRGYSVPKIAAVLEKYAELNLWNKQFSTDYLNRRAQDLGMGYLQPNTFMPKQPDTYERQKPEALRQASVHVAVEGEDLLSIGESKFGGQPSVQKRAVEVKVAEREQSRDNKSTIGRVPNPLIHRGASDATKTAAVYHRGSDFDAGTVAEQHIAGKSFEQIWREACDHAGLHLASKAFHEFINGAKQQGKKFASADAKFLGEKLGFRDLEIVAPKPVIARTAYDSGKRGGTAKDGNELLKEFELNKSAAPIDVELNGDSSLDVEPGRPEINL